MVGISSSIRARGGERTARHFYANCANEPADDGKPYGVRLRFAAARQVLWQSRKAGDTALVGDGQPRTKAPSPLRSAGALQMITREPRFMGSCLFRWELLTSHEPRSGACPSRAQQRSRPGEGWKVPVVPPCRTLLRPGTGALRGKARRITTPVIRGSWAKGGERAGKGCCK
jgi:hypothetical protein